MHYYFTEPSPRPASHRMDKNSYVYLYRQANPSRGRLEIANYAGTEHQDAFTGYLDQAKISNKYKHPNLVTIAVDGDRTGGTQAKESEHHWRLPSTDPRDEGKYLFRLHTLDIYFWTVDDAHTFLNHARETLRPSQMDIDLPPPPAHPTQMSPVVQQLESVAITDPAYHNGQTRNSRPVSEASKQAVASPPPPPPPTAAKSPDEQTQDPAAFAPLAYNPAAPAAPEKRTHREKTPPPEDADVGIGLSGAAGGHQSPHAASPFNPSPFSGHSVGSPPAHPGSPPSVSSGGYVSTPHDPNAHLYTPASSTTAAVSPSVGTPGTASTAAMDSPTAQILGAGGRPGQPQAPLAHVQPQYADYLSSRPAPPGGFANYNYAGGSGGGGAHPASSTGDHALHSQVYRPTEEEHYRPPRKSSAAASPNAEAGAGRYQLEARAEKAEKKFNKFLKKVEKKIG